MPDSETLEGAGISDGSVEIDGKHREFSGSPAGCGSRIPGSGTQSGPQKAGADVPREGSAISWQHVNLESRNSRGNKRALLMVLLVECLHDFLFC